jgi:uncharacterized protein YecT (DUF1311 family)
MRWHLPLLLFVAAQTVPAFARTPAADDPFKNTDCTKATAQLELDYCANRDFEAADRKLNVVYRASLDRSDAKGRNRLKASERKWVDRRDKACTEETAGDDGGSIAPMEYSICLTDKTNARIKELERQRN